MSTLSQIESKIAALPVNLRTEVLDFVQFVNQRHGLPCALVALDAATDAGDSPFFRALNDVGFVGCIETHEKLSTTYKNHLDFSPKAGARP